MATIGPRPIESKTGERIRSANPGGVPAILAIHRSVVEEGAYTLAEPDEFTRTEEHERNAIVEHAEAPGALLMVAETAGQVVGWVQFHNGNRRRTAHSGMLSMMVDERWRGKGVGEALLRALIDWAEESALIEKLTLAIFSTNRRAIRLYEKLGFQVEGCCPRDMMLAGGTYVDSVLMYRFVGGASNGPCEQEAQP